MFYHIVHTISNIISIDVSYFHREKKLTRIARTFYISCRIVIKGFICAIHYYANYFLINPFIDQMTTVEKESAEHDLYKLLLARR